MATKLERDLSIVFPLESGAIVYSKPVTRATFERNYMALAKVYATIQEQGLLLTGTSIAARMLRELQTNGQCDADLFLADIHQRTQIAKYIEPEVEGNVGTYEQFMMADAIKKGVIDEDDVSEIENLLVFTTAASHLSGSRAAANSILTVMLSRQKAQRTSLTLTAFLNSLLTSMQEESSGANAAARMAEQAE
ncbi:hypothetical protein [Paraburkholderia tropica]|uniref:hypothetical protein n=1 Tax=Paraburkholderia tropica TaxID=92647 RepID=UPI002AB210D0|nr:hypothetical protein [Paraburkholderia tropica]